MRSIAQRVVIVFGCCLVALSPAGLDGLDAMQGKNHSARYFKQIRQLNKKSKQVLSKPYQIALQPGKFSKLQPKQSTQKYEQKYRGQWTTRVTGLSPVFAVLLASYFLVGKVNADLDPIGIQMQNTWNARAQQDAIGMANHYAFQAQMSTTTAQLLAQHVLEAQRLAQLKLQQELETQRVQMEQLKVQQKKHADEMLALEQKRLKEQKQLEELKKLEEQEAQEILKEQQKLEELKTKRVQEAKKVEEQKIKELRKEL